MKADLTYTLIDKLISVQDKSILKKINDIIGNVDLEKKVFKVSHAQRQMLMKSEEDIRKGNFITDEELNCEEEKWLKKQSGR